MNLSSTASGSPATFCRDRDDMFAWEKVGRRGPWAWKSRSRAVVSEEHEENSEILSLAFLITPSLHSYRANTQTQPKLSPEVYVFASTLLATSREFSLPFPQLHRSGGIFAAAAPAPRCQPLAHDLNATHAPRHRHSFHHHSTSSPLLQHHHTNTHIRNAPD